MSSTAAEHLLIQVLNKHGFVYRQQEDDTATYCRNGPQVLVAEVGIGNFPQRICLWYGSVKIAFRHDHPLNADLGEQSAGLAKDLHNALIALLQREAARFTKTILEMPAQGLRLKKSQLS